MIVSASYKTDIPTFYGDWFRNRLRAGYCKTLNPYNQQISRVSLQPEDVNGFVFWTKNIGPFLSQLAEVHERGFPFVVQHTINGYPRALEEAVVDSGKAVEYLRRIAETYGTRVCVWRYDTVIESTVTPREFHLETFARLAEHLRTATDEVVLSFAQIYHKTRRNMDKAAAENKFSWGDPPDEWKRELLIQLAAIATAHRIRLTVCSQPHLLVPGVSEARCVDATRLADVGGSAFTARLKGNRKECGCYEARDIGEYDTCPHGCVYCYAVRNRPLAVDRFRQHDPTSEFLFSPPAGAREVAAPDRRIQLGLFDAVDDGQTED